MIRPVKIWILFAVTLAVTVQTTFAGGRSNSSRSFGGNFSRPVVRAPVAAPRVTNSRGVSSFQQSRMSAVVNGNPGNTFRGSTPGVVPQTGPQTGIGSRAQLPGSVRDLRANTNPKVNAPGANGRTPVTGGSILKGTPDGRSLPGLQPSRLADIRNQIGEKNLGGVSENTLPGRGGRITSDNGSGSSRNTGTVVGEEREPITSSAVRDREPAPVTADPNDTRPRNPSPDDDGTNQGRPTLPSPGPDDHRHIDPLPGEHPGSPVQIEPNHPSDGNNGQDIADQASIIDAISGLIGAVGSVSGSLQSGGGDAGYAAPSDSGFSGSSVVESQPVPAAVPAAEPVAESGDVDIELTDVRLVDAGNVELKTGPRLRLTYRNKGAVEIPRFHVTVAVDAGMTLSETAEIVTVEAVGLKPGKSLMVDVRLPVEALKMATDKSGKAVPYSLLAAILDSDERLDETNEENNVMVLAREAIKPIEQAGIVAK